MSTKDDPKRPVKAIVGCLAAGLTAAGTALADGSVTPAEAIGVALAVVLAFGAVYGVSNPQVPAPPGE